MVEKMIIDITRRLRTTMPIVDTNEGPIRPGVEKTQRARLDLALVLKQVIGLDHGHRELSIHMLPTVFVPEEPIFPAHGIRTGVNVSVR